MRQEWTHVDHMTFGPRIIRNWCLAQHEMYSRSTGALQSILSILTQKLVEISRDSKMVSKLDGIDVI